MSPFFANILLKDFDRAIEKANLSMVRYADDLIILAVSEAECFDIHNFCKKELAKLSLSIPDPGPASKTQIYSPTKTAEFLGVGIVINGHDYVINILEAQTQTIRDRIFSFSDFSKLVKEGVTIAKLGQRMEGMISGYLAAYSYCMNVAQLEMALNKTRSDTLKKIYVKDLGMDFSSLSEEKMRFLGLVSDI